jgi:HSP20 family protein
MASVVRYDPFDLVEGMMKSMLRPLAYEVTREADGEMGTIPIDVAEDDRCYTVWAELPGVKKEQVTVSIVGNEVSLAAEIKPEKEAEQAGEKPLRSERRYGKVFRSLRFAAEIDEANAEAKYRDGVLQLTLPKKESDQVKRLTIQ